MLNEEKIVLMTKLAIYEKGEGKKEIPMSRYYRNDYVGVHMLYTFLSVTAGYVLLFALYIARDVEEFLSSLTTMDLRKFLFTALAIYICAELFFLFVTWLLYRHRFKKNRQHLNEYYGNLKSLKKLQKKEQAAAMKMAGGKEAESGEALKENAKEDDRYSEDTEEEDLYPEESEEVDLFPEDTEEEDLYPEESEEVDLFPEDAEEDGLNSKEPEEDDLFPEDTEEEDLYPEESEEVDLFPEDAEEDGLYPEEPEEDDLHPEEDHMDLNVEEASDETPVSRDTKSGQIMDPELAVEEALRKMAMDNSKDDDDDEEDEDEDGFTFSS